MTKADARKAAQLAGYMWFLHGRKVEKVPTRKRYLKECEIKRLIDKRDTAGETYLERELRADCDRRDGFSVGTPPGGIKGARFEAHKVKTAPSPFFNGKRARIDGATFKTFN